MYARATVLITKQPTNPKPQHVDWVRFAFCRGDGADAQMPYGVPTSSRGSGTCVRHAKVRSFAGRADDHDAPERHRSV